MEITVSKNLEVDAIKSHLLALDAQRDDSDVTPMKLNKLLYFAQANYLASTGFRLFDEDTYAFRHGPVYRPIYQKYSGAQIIVVEHPEETDPVTSLPSDVSQFVNEIWDTYGKLSASELRRISHEGHPNEPRNIQTPWKKNYLSGVYDLIPDSDIAPYFREVVPLEYRVFHTDISFLDHAFLTALDEIDEEELGRARAFLHGQGV